MAMINGCIIAMPSVAIQSVILVTTMFALNTTNIDSDMEMFIVLILFSWLIRSVYDFFLQILDYIIDDAEPDSKPPRWKDPAPYLPNGGSYGYAMLQYRVKKKSGHASPKHGGERQPLTSSTMTSWLARTPFRLALCWTMRYLTAVVLLGSFNGPGMDS